MTIRYVCDACGTDYEDANNVGVVQANYGRQVTMHYCLGEEHADCRRLAGERAMARALERVKPSESVTPSGGAIEREGA